MDADRLKETAEECIRRRDFAEAKALLKKAAELAPLRNDIRDLLFHVSQIEVSGGRRRRGVSPDNGDSGSGMRVWIWVIVYIVSVLAAGAGGFWAGRYLDWGSVSSSKMNEESPDGSSKGESETPSSGDTQSPLGGGGKIVSERERAENGFLERSPDHSGTRGDIPEDAGGAVDPGAQHRENAQAEIQALMKDAKYSDAIQKLEEMMKAKSDPIEARKLRENLARCHYLLGKQTMANNDFDMAIGQMKRAIEIDGAEADYFCGLGEAYCQRGPRPTGGKDDYELARQALEKALALNKDHLASYDILGLTYLRMGNQVKAAEQYQTIIKKAPKSKEAEKARTALRSNGMRVPE
ncbi:MAG TPA: tetratricopeptide repeat protein [Candidatus Sumerlaeota bacterium]|nr:tetratricopeptide repeat protein [Candidatus Sumerlaeota bacterium]HPS00926.1 tetratricopeptide repeat protein [Candidatus Sumerlaeota bacterium]